MAADKIMRSTKVMNLIGIQFSCQENKTRRISEFACREFNEFNDYVLWSERGIGNLKSDDPVNLL